MISTPLTMPASITVDFIAIVLEQAKTVLDYHGVRIMMPQNVMSILELLVETFYINGFNVPLEKVN